MPEHRFGIVVLAAGASQRMGTPKQLLHLGGRSLIRRAAQMALDAMAPKVIVVLGAHATSIQPELEGLNLTVVINPAWNTGMGSSVACGVDTLLREMPDAKGVLFMLVDQPSVTSVSLSKLWQACAHDPCAAISASCYGEVVGTPAIFGRDYFAELLKLEGSHGARSLLKRYADNVRTVDLPEAAFDLDTPEDFAVLSNADSAELPTSRPAVPEVSPSPTMNPNHTDSKTGPTRRQFMAHAAAAGAGVVAGPALVSTSSAAESVATGTASPAGTTLPVKLRVNGAEHALQLDPRVTLLDALREGLGLTGSKKGCDHGQCGACSVLVNGRRINSCLALAVVHEGDEITTIEGLAKGEQLHPVQQAFVEHDGFQCGYCTPGQICSAVALLKEGHASDDAQIREWMSGNICRCGAYTNIVAAIREAKAKMGGAA